MFVDDADSVSIKIVGGKPAEPASGATRESNKQVLRWFDSLMADTFA